MSICQGVLVGCGVACIPNAVAVVSSAVRDLQSCLTYTLHSECVPHGPGDGGLHGLPSRILQRQG